MNYKGVIIEESLADKKVLSNVKILETNIEEVLSVLEKDVTKGGFVAIVE
ncbi:MAG: hypothetical protein PHC97_03735 [Patescibacteria group bacterium]|nr:hypothetical protein [Patescibacteria group bacterium]